ncbi:MAG: hypothetical protein KatS3mg024_0319 [Armatimonadota bacterium]|nr:MAG: hypothetical protein KatS3mg024_0319 [Armatimonadota bacterium]
MVNEAQQKLKEPKQFIVFTGNHDADNLLNDLDNHPHAFVVACIMDRQIKTERAWTIPWELKDRPGSFEMDFLANLTQEDIAEAMGKPTPLHRFVETMAENLFHGIQRIIEH